MHNLGACGRIGSGESRPLQKVIPLQMDNQHNLGGNLQKGSCSTGRDGVEGHRDVTRVRLCKDMSHLGMWAVACATGRLVCLLGNCLCLRCISVGSWTHRLGTLCQTVLAGTASCNGTKQAQDGTNSLVLCSLHIDTKLTRSSRPCQAASHVHGV